MPVVQYDDGGRDVPLQRRTRFGLIMDVATMWGCSILFGFLAAFVFLWRAVVYIILMSDELIKVPITWIRNLPQL